MRTSVIIHDPETLNSLTQEEVETYLQAHGWWNYERWSREGPPAGFWKRPEEHESDTIVIPASYNADYAQRMSEMLRIVAKHEGHDNQRKVYYAMKDLHNAADIVITFNGSAKLTIGITAEWDADISEEGHEVFHQMMHILRAAIEQIKMPGGEDSSS